MYIKSVTIDGFKSYAQRTEVAGFDPLFNAITGLNGSGKSNILDSICFLLGITNLSQVRASNLQDLVYKNGHAGINKATVSIVFDNSNKDQSPIGMEMNNEITVTRQIVIGGRNKYLINGVNAQNSRVSDLFRSVGLNVNNPHFLIMQGRVTKVMNMKPPEILSMIEEATGTSMYEAKKESAQKMIVKKESKLNQINAVLTEEITPTLEKLREERSSYLQYQVIQREMKQLNSLLVAYSFYKAEMISSRAEDDLKTMNEEKEQIENQIKEAEKSIRNLSEGIKVLEKQRDDVSSNSLKQCEANVLEQQRHEARAQSDFKHHCDCMNTERKKMQGLEKNKKEDEKLLQKKNEEINKMKALCEKLQHEITASEASYAQAQKHYEAVVSGLSANDDGEDATWNAQLIQTKKDISELQSATKQASMKLKHCKEEIKKKSATLHKTETAYKRDESVLKQSQAKLDQLTKEINKLGYEDGKEEELQQTRRELAQQLDKIKYKVGDIYTKYPRLQFDYSDPEANWDRSRVKGLVAELIDVNPEHATALEVVAGSRLYEIVVDSNVTGEKLLKNGRLQRRFTIIPMNKISARQLSNDVINRAKSLVGSDNANMALTLVGSDDQVRKAMEYVFGSTLVCDNMEHAKKVAFDKGVNVRTVTLDGEVFDPAGTLTGGAQSRQAPVLAELMAIKDARNNMTKVKQELANVENELRRIKDVAGRYRTLSHQFELKEKECDMLRERLSLGTHGKLLEEINELKKILEESENILATSKEKEAAMVKKCQELQAKIDNAPAEKEKELKSAEDGIKVAAKRVEIAKEKSGEKIDNFETLKLEISEVEKGISDYVASIAAVEKNLAEMAKKKDELEAVHKECKEHVKNCQSELKNQREQLHLKSQEIQEKAAQVTEIQRKATEADLELKEKIYSISKHQKESSEATSKMNSLLKEYDWIAQEKADFGKSGTIYDFNTNNPKETARKLAKLQETEDELRKRVNMRAMSLLGKVEEKYLELVRKKKIIEEDREKIARTISELDQKKNDAVTKAYEQVNKDFGKIFSMLLPGATAKLSPPEGQSVLAGLEFRVGFGDVWKENLSELSGGQRSLVALSLILAMLLLKPAPIYILDEVDAALDLSHTQNIGRMLKEHFKKSQFIVVSLKDGMFNNANVLFRTKFVDGVSTVGRYTQQSGRDPLAPLPNGGDGLESRKGASKTTKKRARV